MAHGIQWMKIPGVIGAGTVRYIDNSCSFDTIEITVQPSFMESVRKQILSHVNGVPTMLALDKPSGCHQT
jgi:hypothetical protein